MKQVFEFSTSCRISSDWKRKGSCTQTDPCTVLLKQEKYTEEQKKSRLTLCGKRNLDFSIPVSGSALTSADNGYWANSFACWVMHVLRLAISTPTVTSESMEILRNEGSHGRLSLHSRRNDLKFASQEMSYKNCFCDHFVRETHVGRRWKSAFSSEEEERLQFLSCLSLCCW